MLKKISHIILASLLLISTMGVAVSKHYCSGSFVSFSVFHEAKSCCGDSDCCHNEDLFFKVKDDFSSPAIPDVPQVTSVDIFSQELFTMNLITSPEPENIVNLVDTSPPPLTNQKALSLKQAYLL